MTQKRCQPMWSPLESATQLEDPGNWWAGNARGDRCGRELRSCRPGWPSVRNRLSHLYTVARETPAASATCSAGRLEFGKAGWVNWSGLATLPAALGRSLNISASRLLTTAELVTNRPG